MNNTRYFQLLIVFLLIGFILIIPLSTVKAATTLVTNETELVAALTAPTPGDTIVLQNNITLSASLPAITTALTILGSGFTIDAGGAGNLIFNISASGNLTLANITLTGGVRTMNGGAIVNNGTLTINNSTLVNNFTSGSRGGDCQQWRYNQYQL